MNLSIVLGMLVLCSLWMSVCRFTVSNAFERSRAIATVLFFLLKAWVIVLFISCNAVVVECLCLKPCWCGGMIVLLVMCGRMIFSSVFALGESSAIWRALSCLLTRFGNWDYFDYFPCVWDCVCVEREVENCC